MQKTFTGLTVKAADKGEVSAVFSTFGVKDHDGDVTLPGAFGEQRVKLLRRRHHRVRRARAGADRVRQHDFDERLPHHLRRAA